MMFKHNFVAVIKSEGKIMRENSDGAIHLPFGSEYNIHLKNLESRKAVVDIEIDGVDVLDGNSIIVDSNSETTVEGFLENQKVIGKFKFIQKTEKIADHRGDRLEDGLVRIEFRFEKPITYIYPDTKWYNHRPYFGHSDGLIGSSMYCCSQDEGITVKGSDSNQEFDVGWVDTLEKKSTVIIFHLKGKTNKGTIKTPISVKTRLTCETCGTRSKSINKYCRECGTRLI